MSNLINQNNQSITLSGGWFINHIGSLNWTEKLNYKSSNEEQTIINDLTSNGFPDNFLSATYIVNGSETSVNFNNPSNDDYVSSPNTGLLDNTMHLYYLNFNQAYNSSFNFSNAYLNFNKASAITTGGSSIYWIANVFNNSMSSYDVAINGGKQTSLSSVTNYDLFAINMSGSNITYDISYP